MSEKSDGVIVYRCDAVVESRTRALVWPFKMARRIGSYEQPIIIDEAISPYNDRVLAKVGFSCKVSGQPRTDICKPSPTKHVKSHYINPNKPKILLGNVSIAFGPTVLIKNEMCSLISPTQARAASTHISPISPYFHFSLIFLWIPMKYLVYHQCAASSIVLPTARMENSLHAPLVLRMLDAQVSR